MAVLAGLAILTLGITATMAARYVQANRRRLDDLEAKLDALTDAERIIARAHHRNHEPERRRGHLKLLGLAPVAWVIERHARVTALGAAAATVATVGLVVDHTQQSAKPIPSMKDPVEELADDPPLTVRANNHPTTTSTSTMSTTNPAAVVPPRSAAAMGAAPTTVLPTDTVPPPSTTTILTTTTTTVELPPACLKPQVFALGIKLCTPVD